MLVIKLMRATIRRGGGDVGRSWSGDGSLASRVLRGDQLAKYAPDARGILKNSYDLYM